jgi:NADH-quinone oxidoreductase subunit G
VLANTLDLQGFDFDSTEDVRNTMFKGEKASTVAKQNLNNNMKELVEIETKIKSSGLQRIGEVRQYESDPIVRRSVPLQKTKYNIKPMARLHPDEMRLQNVVEGDTVLVKQDKGSAILTVQRDIHVAMGCLRVAAAHEDTIGLGDLMGDISLEKIEKKAVS